MRENGVPNKATVLEWEVIADKRDFEVVKNDGTLHCSVENAAVSY